MDFIGGLIGLSILQVVLLAVGATVGAICFAVAAMFTRTAAPSLSKRAVLLASFLFPMVSLFYLEAGLFIPTILQSARG